MKKDIIRLNSSSKEIQYLQKKDNRLATVISMVGELSYSLHSDGYDFLVHEIIEQMLSIKAGKRIYDRLVELCHGSISLDTISKLSAEEIKSVGTSLAKAQYIMHLTDSILSNSLNLSSIKEMSDSDAIKALTSVHGIGNWTAKMYLIFVLNRQDILPYEDGAFKQTYKWMYSTDDVSPKSIEKKCKCWKPYSSIASRYMYRALDIGLTKTTLESGN